MGVRGNFPWLVVEGKPSTNFYLLKMPLPQSVEATIINLRTSPPTSIASASFFYRNLGDFHGDVFTSVAVFVFLPWYLAFLPWTFVYFLAPMIMGSGWPASLGRFLRRAISAPSPCGWEQDVNLGGSTAGSMYWAEAERYGNWWNMSWRQIPWREVNPRFIEIRFYSMEVDESSP